MSDFVLLPNQCIPRLALALNFYQNALQSSMPKPDEKGYELIKAELEAIFDAKKDLLGALPENVLKAENEALRAQIDELTIQLADYELKQSN